MKGLQQASLPEQSYCTESKCLTCLLPVPDVVLRTNTQPLNHSAAAPPEKFEFKNTFRLFFYIHTVPVKNLDTFLSAL